MLSDDLILISPGIGMGVTDMARNDVVPFSFTDGRMSESTDGTESGRGGTVISPNLTLVFFLLGAGDPLTELDVLVILDGAEQPQGIVSSCAEEVLTTCAIIADKGRRLGVASAVAEQPASNAVLSVKDPHLDRIVSR